MTVVPAFGCPADPRVRQTQIAQKDNSAAALTSYLGVAGRTARQPLTLPMGDAGGALFSDSRVRLTDITDGTSNTLLLGERPPSDDFQFGWWCAGAGAGPPTGTFDLIQEVREANTG